MVNGEGQEGQAKNENKATTTTKDNKGTPKKRKLHLKGHNAGTPRRKAKVNCMMTLTCMTYRGYKHPTHAECVRRYPLACEVYMYI